MELKVKFRGGGSFFSYPLIFSSDVQYGFVAWKNCISGYHIKTGNYVKQFIGLENNIIGFNCYRCSETDYLIASSASGEVMWWKVDVGLQISKRQISVDNINLITFLLIPHSERDEYINRKALITWNSNNEKDYYFGVYDFFRNKLTPLDLKLKSKQYKVAIGGQENCFFAAVQGNSLYFMKLCDSKKYYKKSMKGREFTCVACHPVEECVITGDNTGRVLVWRELSTSDFTRTVYHWHQLPVNSVCFSTSGRQFYSGGGECVLVMWHLDEPLQKKFLPRISSIIEQISVAQENKFIAIGAANNNIHIVDPRLQYVSVLQHLTLGGEFPAGIIFDSRSKTLILNGSIGCIQFYSPYDKKLLYNLDVVGQNKLTQEREYHIENTNITMIATSKTGLWLATLEYRKDVEINFESRLKFWQFDTEKQIFSLNTSVELPHEKKVTGVCFERSANDADLKCVTIGEDKKFKIWHLIPSDTIYSKGSCWKCSGIGYYRNLPCNALAFSFDGSLLAVAFESIVTTWSPDTCDLKCSLLHPLYRDALRFVQFGTGNKCHLLVAATDGQLSVWNLLTLSMLWTVSINVSLLVGDPLTPYMALITKEQKLYIFTPASSSPICIKDDLVNNGRTMLTASFVPTANVNDIYLHWYQRSHLLFMDSNQELFSLEENVDDDTPYSIDDDIITNSISTFAIPKFRSGLEHQPSTLPSYINAPTNFKKIEEMLNSPLHTMIPIRLTCHSLLQSIVEKYSDDGKRKVITDEID